MRFGKIVLVSGLFLSVSAFAWERELGRGQSELPPCVDTRGARMAEPNNEQVLDWKQRTPNQYKDRGFIRGTLVGVYDAKRSHLHLDVFIGGTGPTGRDNDIEVIYNQAFGQVNVALQPGVEVIACGDYITSTKQSGHYPPSPLGAILHWVHKAMGGSHPNGFLMIDGKLFGQMDAPPRRRFFDDAFGFWPAFLQ